MLGIKAGLKQIKKGGRRVLELISHDFEELKGKKRTNSPLIFCKIEEIWECLEAEVKGD